MIGSCRNSGLGPILAALFVSAATLAGGPVVLVGHGSTARYLDNAGDPGLDLTWVAPDFGDGFWPEGRFGFGFEHGDNTGVKALLRTGVPRDTRSVYCRARFTIDDPQRVEQLLLGVDYDDGFVAWINGVEVARSPSMHRKPLDWDARPSSHESSNGAAPRFHPRFRISSAISLLRRGENVFAIAVWNKGRRSADMVVVPQLLMNPPLGILVTRGPYLQAATPNEIIVRWRTDRPTDSRVTFGPAPGSLTHSVSDPQKGTDHSLRLTGLEPDTRLFYSVGTTTTLLTGDDDSHFFRTAPKPGTRRPMRFWVLGDSGTATAYQGFVRDAYQRWTASRHTDLWLMLGDNAYRVGSDESYQAAVFDAYPRRLRQSVLWSTPGNHDVVHGVGFDAPYYDIFEFPTDGRSGGVPSGTEAWYSFDFGNVHFISLNSAHVDLSVGSPMLLWLERDLELATADWIVALWHHAAYATGRQDSDREEESISVRRGVLPLLDAHDVDLVLSGHMHAYQRSFLLDGHYGTSSTLTPEMILDAGDGDPEGDGAYRKPTARTPNSGIVYVVIGSSGEAAEFELGHPAMAFMKRALGSVVLDVDGRQLDGRFLDARGVVQDHFRIVKGGHTEAAGRDE